MICKNSSMESLYDAGYSFTLVAIGVGRGSPNGDIPHGEIQPCEVGQLPQIRTSYGEGSNVTEGQNAKVHIWGTKFGRTFSSYACQILFKFLGSLK